MPIASDVQTAVSQAEELSGCKLMTVRMSDEDRAAVQDYVELIKRDRDKAQHLRNFTIAGLMTILHSNGIAIGKTVVSDHVLERCACERSQ